MTLAPATTELETGIDSRNNHRQCWPLQILGIPIGTYLLRITDPAPRMAHGAITSYRDELTNGHRAAGRIALAAGVFAGLVAKLKNPRTALFRHSLSAFVVISGAARTYHNECKQRMPEVKDCHDPPHPHRRHPHHPARPSVQSSVSQKSERRMRFDQRGMEAPVKTVPGSLHTLTHQQTQSLSQIGGHLCQRGPLDKVHAIVSLPGLKATIEVVRSHAILLLDLRKLSG